MRCFCVKISAVDGMDSSGKYAAVIKLMSVRPKGMSQQHCTVGMVGHVINNRPLF